MQVWADLGCGSGTFTYALATRLNPNSVIYAVDQEHQILQPTYNQVEISFIQSDFLKGIDQLPMMHGVLMANSLHFVEEKAGFLARLRKKLFNNGEIMVVEYESTRPNQWVPFPVNFEALTLLMKEMGINSIEKIGERSSIYQDKIYAAHVSL
ncbi:MAG: class I SAM-dependent methyltransferase [Marinoscillum sp.]